MAKMEKLLYPTGLREQLGGKIVMYDVKVDQEKCVGCESCVEVCEEGTTSVRKIKGTQWVIGFIGQ